ncbi:unnamed protein product [Tuber aestivum]|uniref:Uncharacterized protein n=1 Tax=Tuber aestivum TaxID=59557 RepID=A0A292PZW7_9PEZI|nr:unnamed protein product [Tuber aestivum]
MLLPKHILLLVPLLLSPHTAAEQFPLAENVETNTNLEEDNSPFIFTSLQGLLSQWANVYAPMGFSVVPGVVPPQTLLYHARRDGDAPPKMEWLAFDPEMSYGIFAARKKPLFLNTYSSTRELKVLYFDGGSAVLCPSKTDAQDVILHGKVHGREAWCPEDSVDGEHDGGGDGDDGRDRRPVAYDYTRARELCEWGSGIGVEGFVRMDTGFELLWCDFGVGLDLVSRLNITMEEPKGEDTKPGHGPCHGHREWRWWWWPPSWGHHCPGHGGPGHPKPPHPPKPPKHPQPPELPDPPKRPEPPEIPEPPKRPEPPRHEHNDMLDGHQSCGRHEGHPEHPGDHRKHSWRPSWWPGNGKSPGRGHHHPPGTGHGGGCHFGGRTGFYPHRREWPPYERGHHHPPRWGRPPRGEPGNGHPGNGRPHPPPENGKPGEPSHDPHSSLSFPRASKYANEISWEWMRSGSWNFGSPEARVKLDTCRMTTFYSVPIRGLTPPGTLNAKRSHSLLNITHPQAEAIKKQIEDNLSNKHLYCSGTDWQEVSDGIARRYLTRLLELRTLLNTPRFHMPPFKLYRKVRTLAHALVMPFYEIGSSAEEAEERCVKEYTGRLDTTRLGPSENLLVDSVEGVLSRICKLSLGIYTEIMEHPPLTPSQDDGDENGDEPDHHHHRIFKWKGDLEALMLWLDWSGWYKCERTCSSNEICAIPLWPLFGAPWDGVPGERFLENPRCVSVEYMEGRGTWRGLK